MKMEAICSSEKCVDFQRTTRGYIREDRTLEDYLLFEEGYVIKLFIILSLQ
jgi:hypothetical protein